MAEQEITFREATGKDALAFLELMSRLAGETDYLAMDTTGLSQSVEEMAEVLDSLHDAVDQLCLLALAGDELIGVLTVRTRPQAKVNHIGSVFLAVRQPYWGYGIGRLLLEEATEWALQEGVLARLELTVQVRNTRAVRLYEQSGFDIEGTKRRGAVSAKGDFLDVYLMAKMIG